MLAMQPNFTEIPRCHSLPCSSILFRLIETKGGRVLPNCRLHSWSISGTSMQAHHLVAKLSIHWNRNTSTHVSFFAFQPTDFGGIFFEIICHSCFVFVFRSCRSSCWRGFSTSF